MAIPECDKGKCKTCGFLGLSHELESTESLVLECSWDQRASGEIFAVRKWFPHGGSAHFSLPVRPVCVRGILEIFKETGDPYEEIGSDVSVWNKPSAFRTHAAEVLDKNRQCAWWREYTPGFGPQKLWEVVMFEELEVRLETNRREWERRFEDDRRIWQERIDRERDLRNESERQSTKRENRTFALAALFVSVLALGIAYAQYRIQLHQLRDAKRALTAPSEPEQSSEQDSPIP